MSRLTFHEAQSMVCWQKRLRDNYASEPPPPVPHLEVGRSVIRPVSLSTARQIILKYEWLGTLPSSCSAHFGIFFGSYCAGVCSFGIGPTGANVFAYQEFNLQREQLAYLARGACVHWAPSGSNSKLVSWACKLLGRASGVKLVLAYSDSDAGEIGTIYQAANWICVGRGGSIRQWVSPAGRVMDQKVPSNRAKRYGGTRADWCARLRAAGWREQDSNPKWRYVYIIDKLDRALADLVERKRVTYPKRAASADGGTPGDQPGGSGSIPTAALKEVSDG